MKFKISLSLLALFSTTLLGTPSVYAAKYANARFLVESPWLAERLQGPMVLVVDARTKAEYDKGHLPDAVHLDPSELSLSVNDGRANLASVETIASMLGKKGVRNRIQIVIYDHNTGPDAARLFWTLDYMGHKNMALLNGGWAKWISENRPVTTKIFSVKPERFQVSVDLQKLATGAWILNNLNQHNIAILDVRDPLEFTGEKITSSRAGHIPGSINLPWQKNLTPDGTIRSATALRNMFYKAQIKKGKEIVVLSRNGIHAAQTYFVLRLLGYEHIRIYDGSWHEWSNRADYPVETGVTKMTPKNSATC